MPAGRANSRPRQLTRPARPSHRSRRSSPSCGGAKGGDILFSWPSAGREARDSTPKEVTSSRRNPEGPCPRTRTIVSARGAHPHLGFQCNATVAEQTSRRSNTGGESTGPVAPDAPATPQTRGARERGRRIVSGPRAPRRTERRVGHDVGWGGKVAHRVTRESATPRV